MPLPATMPDPQRTTTDSLQIWCFLDGKPGHENQSLGLIEALERCTNRDLEVHHLPVSNKYPARLLGHGHRGRLLRLPPPHLLIGAGHATHMVLWRSRRRFGGRSVVLMKPSLPLRCFDLCLIPDVHQVEADSQHVLLTQGVLNRIRPSSQQQSDHALCLIGGPSSHYEWSDEHLLSQLRPLFQQSTDLRWTVATSRRTPDSLLGALRESFPHLTIVPPGSVSRDWLPKQLSLAATTWVSEDSVSMTYEAVTSGARVGILELPRTRETRVTRGMDRLVETGRVTRFAQWQSTGQLQAPQTPLFESQRVAQEIVRRFLPHSCRQHVA